MMWKRCTCATSTLPVWIKVKEKPQQPPLMGVMPGNPLGATWPSRIIHQPRGSTGRVSAGRHVPPEAPPFQKSLLIGTKVGFWGVPAEPVRLTGVPLFTCPSDQIKFRGLHPSALPLCLSKLANKRGNLTESVLRKRDLRSKVNYN